jgi:phosphatidylinositol glycan class N
LLIGLVFHVVYIGSVFDCYFTSPVVHGMQRHGVQVDGSAAAKRLVLIIGVPYLTLSAGTSWRTISIGDGLRADLLFNVNAFSDISGSPEIVAPFLRSIAEERGAFGISHTRVPTESRPGHVAIIGKFFFSEARRNGGILMFTLGGMYEDVSAVTKVLGVHWTFPT